MSGAPVGRNPKNMRYRGNNTRPGGASALADTQDPIALLAALDGNRQTRRLALKNAKKYFRKVDAAQQTNVGRA